MSSSRSGGPGPGGSSSGGSSSGSPDEMGTAGHEEVLQGVRRPLVAGNWKMNLDHLEAVRVVSEVGLRLHGEDMGSVEASVHPPFTDIRSVQTTLEDRTIPVALGAQDCHQEDRGAFTGEVSAPMLARLGVRYVIVGHSERRRYQGETDELVGLKLRAVLRHGMMPILCVGETAAQRDAGATSEVISSQLKSALDGLSGQHVARVVIAYEPLWAIGSGTPAGSEDAQAVARHIRQIACAQAPDGTECAGALRVLYGGSVTADNVGDLLSQPDVDGVLVGGASLEPASFAEIILGASRVVG